MEAVAYSAEKMRSYFTKIEKNNYVPEGTPGHNKDGYLEVTIGDGNQYLASEQAVDILNGMVEEMGEDPAKLKELLTADPNFLGADRDTTEGVWALPFHVNSTWGRYSARNRVLDTVKATNADGSRKFPLDLQLNSLATKVLFQQQPRKAPRAVGVEYLEGKSAYQGDPRHSASQKGTKRQVCARKEVILSGGAFNTPQLLRLSGVGAAAELRKHRIPVVVDLPGVGTNMQDNQEMGIFGLAAEDFAFAPPPTGPEPACTFRGPPGDPCYDLFLGGAGPYTRAGPNTNAFMFRTAHAADAERDMFVFAGPFTFRGFWPATPGQDWTEPPNTWGMHTVHMHPRNRQGYVRLRSADPTETPEINFNLYAEGGDADLGAIGEAVAWGRRAFLRVDPASAAGPVTITGPPCAAGVRPDGTCATPGADEDFIRSDTFGHHVTSTCPIGADNDRMAVLDSAFRVRGTAGLRVVDASAFPRIPGAFPVVSVYMISEKASEVILAN